MTGSGGDTVPVDQVGTGAELAWNRPHPLTLVVEIGSALRQMFFVLILVGFDLVDVGAALELLVVLGPLGAAIGRWFTTRYALSEEALHHHHGLLWRQRQVLPRANIQNVSTRAGIVARLGSVVELNVSDASSNGDITLRFVSQAEADRLTTLLRSASVPAPAPVPASPHPDRPDSDWPGVNRPDPDWPGLDRPGPPLLGAAPPPTGPPVAMPGPPVALPGPLAGPAGPSAGLPGPVGSPVETPPLVAPSLGQLIRFEATAMGPVTAVALALVVVLAGPAALGAGLVPDQAGDGRPWVAAIVPAVALLFAAGAQVVSRVMQLGTFELRAEPDRLRIRSGLLTEARITARRQRIQQVRVDRQLVHRRLGLERVAFETADLDVSSSAGTRYLSPAGPAGSWPALARECFGRLDLDEEQLQPVSPLTRRRTLVRFVLTALPMAALWLAHPVAGVAVPVAVIALGWWYSRRRYQELGWALSDDQLLLRSGVFLGTLHLINLDKVQIVRTSSTLFQRRLDLATLHLATAGHGFTSGLVSLPDLTAADAADLARHLAIRASRTPVPQTL